jgi:hypothetical protein
VTAYRIQTAYREAREELAEIKRRMADVSASAKAARACGEDPGRRAAALARLAAETAPAQAKVAPARKKIRGQKQPAPNGTGTSTKSTTKATTSTRANPAPGKPARGVGSNAARSTTRRTRTRRPALRRAEGFGGTDGGLPLLLLPLRLETKYDGSRLLVRAYPDDVHSDGHEPELTPRERRWRAQFLATIEAGRERADFLAAWIELVRRVGAERALWLATASDEAVAGDRSGAWSRAATARLLPDRLIAFAWTDLNQPPIRADAAAPVREALPLGPDPEPGDPADPFPLGAAAAWLHDLGQSRAAGMMIEIPLPAADAEVVRLVVVGARGRVDPATQAEELASLLNAHRCTTGLDLIAAGTPTNNLPGERVPYRLRPDPRALYEQELDYSEQDGRSVRRLPHFQSSQAAGPPLNNRFAAGFSLAEALGIDPTVLGFAAGSGDVSLGPVGERSLITMLDVLFRPGVVDGLTPGVSAEAVGSAFRHLTEFVSASGPFPTLRLGRQPYGILPVFKRDRSRMPPQDARLLDLLDALRDEVFKPATENIPRVGSPRSDSRGAAGTLLDMMRSDALARQLLVRPVASGRLVDAILPGLPPAIRAPIDGARAVAAAQLGQLGHPFPDAATVVHAALFPTAGLVTRPLVAPEEPPAPASDELPNRYLRRLASLPIPQLIDFPGTAPQAILFDLALLSLLQAADSAARGLLVDGGTDPLVFGDPAHPLGAPVRRLFAPTPGDPTRPVWQTISESATQHRDFLDARTLLQQLAQVPEGTLKILLAAALPLLSSRLDAWYSGFATRRLREIRSAPPGGVLGPFGFGVGIGVGAFGLVEDIRRASPARARGGYVHAPSAEHAATAAVILTSSLAHADSGQGSSFAVDLSSRRVRTALELLDGVRNGQAVGALLGYRLERRLVDAGTGASPLVRRLRAAAPLVANRREPSPNAAETVAADNVVDGLVLLRRAGYDGKATVPSVDTLTQVIGPVDQDQRNALKAALDAAADSVDAVSDLLLAESVHGLVLGNAARAGAAGDAASGAPVPPPAEAEVARTPQRGVPVIHRVLLIIDHAATRAPGWDDTSRATAEPLVDAWASRILPSPSSVRLRFAFGSAEEVMTATLADLLQEARDGSRSELALGAIDVMLSADASLPNGGPWLASRLASLAEMRRREGMTGGARLFPDRPADWDGSVWTVAELAELARTARAVVGGSRVLAPADLTRPGAAAAARLDSGEVEALEQRVTALQENLSEAREALLGAGNDVAKVRALRSAELLAIAAAPEGAPLGERVAAAIADIDRRLAAAADPVNPDGPSRMRALLGSDFPVIQRLSTVDSTVGDSFAADIGATETDVRAFLDRAAAVRPAVARIEALSGLADAVPLAAGDAGPALRLAVGQQPLGDGEQWVALPGTVAAGRVSLVAAVPGGAAAVAADGTVAGLVIDEWTEVVPSKEAETSIAFHFEAPSNAAPNVFLLLVPNDAALPWTAESVRDHVLDALDLARLRAVDSNLIPGAGQLLPALLAPNSDFPGNLVSQLTRPGAQP